MGFLGFRQVGQCELETISELIQQGLEITKSCTSRDDNQVDSLLACVALSIFLDLLDIACCLQGTLNNILIPVNVQASDAHELMKKQIPESQVIRCLRFGLQLSK